MPEPYHSLHDGYLKRYQETQERHIIGTGRELKGKKKKSQKSDAYHKMNIGNTLILGIRNPTKIKIEPQTVYFLFLSTSAYTPFY